MMCDRAEMADLLETARDVVRKCLVPHLPAERRYEALMVANAVAIAARRFEAGEAPLEEVRGLLAGYYDRSGASLEELEARLAADIRAGAFDEEGPRREKAHAILTRMTMLRVSESNPKALRK